MKVVLGPIDTCITLDNSHISEDNPLGQIHHALIVIENEMIVWLGEKANLPKPYKSWPQVGVAQNTLALPGLIDCHTHLVFAGNRAQEFEARLAGKSYQELAQAGGGIRHTVAQTRAASEETLLELAQKRLHSMLSHGVTTIEAKSGYGLDFETEIKLLRVQKTLNETQPISIFSTLMAAHDFPDSSEKSREDYISHICTKLIPAVAEEQLATFQDVFIEEGYYSVNEGRRLLNAGKALGLTPKVHADEFATIGATNLAAELQAASADHLLQVTDEGIASLAGQNGKTVPVLLPATAFFLGMTDYAPAQKLLAANLPVALATDFNPGSSNCLNIWFVMSLAAFQMRMPIDAIVKAVTINAAKALRCNDSRGSLTVGKRADITLCRGQNLAELIYNWSESHIDSVWIGGQKVYSHDS